MQGEGDDCSLTDTIPEDSVSCSGVEIQTPNTLRKGIETLKGEPILLLHHRNETLQDLNKFEQIDKRSCS